MLILSRNPIDGRDKVFIEYPGGGVIEIQLLDIRGSQVRLGFNAPNECKILRGEVPPEGCGKLSHPSPSTPPG